MSEPRRVITEADLRAAMVRADADALARVKAQTDAFSAFMAAVPLEFREHPEILQMASMAAMSTLMPMHPRDAERLAARYEQIVNP